MVVLLYHFDGSLDFVIYFHGPKKSFNFVNQVLNTSVKLVRKIKFLYLSHFSYCATFLCLQLAVIEYTVFTRLTSVPE